VVDVGERRLRKGTQRFARDTTASWPMIFSTRTAVGAEPR
jgi:hypothetical protein